MPHDVAPPPAGLDPAAGDSVSARLLAEGAIPLADLAGKLRPARGVKVAHSTLWRWHMKGKRGVAGELVYLEAFLGPGGYHSSEAALARFLDALTARPAVPPPSRAERSSTRRRREQAAASRRNDQRPMGAARFPTHRRARAAGRAAVP